MSKSLLKADRPCLSLEEENMYFYNDKQTNPKVGYDEYISEKESEFHNYIQDVKKKYYEKISPNFFEKIKYSLDRLEEAFSSNEHFTKEKIYLSFNGGKDCLAAYILVKYYLYCEENSLDYSIIKSFESFITEKHKPLNNSKRIRFVYFMNKKNYDCEEDYAWNFSKKEEVEIHFCYSDYILGLNFLIQKSDLKYIIMGTRADDIKKDFPRSENLIHASTAPYPEFLRFYPVYKFDYADIWRLILLTKFEYLELYDKGFSSIGNKYNTKINENLIFKMSQQPANLQPAEECKSSIYADNIDQEVNCSYNDNNNSLNFLLPAWCLKEMLSERSFRNIEK